MAVSVHAQFALLFLALAACGDAGSSMAEQDPARVIAAFNDAIAACSARTSDAGVIDQAAVAAAEWTVAARTSRLQVTNTTHAAAAYPTLRAGEYEATDWAHAGHAEQMQLIRWDELTTNRTPDHCLMNGRVDNDTALPAVIAGVTRRFGRAPDRTGLVPRGGDFLTPRSDDQQTGYYWALPRHDVYLRTAPGGFASINIVAMPDRETLDQYSPDRPDRQLVILPGEPEQ